MELCVCLCVCACMLVCLRHVCMCLWVCVCVTKGSYSQLLSSFLEMEKGSGTHSFKFLFKETKEGAGL